MSVNIQLEWTPNPSTLKYVVDRAAAAPGAMNFTTAEAAAARSRRWRTKLMDIQGVTAVMLGTNFVTVTKGDDGEWDELNDAVMAHARLAPRRRRTGGGRGAVPDGAAAHAARRWSSGSARSSTREIRPAVAQDGGDITLDRFENGVVYLHMQGSCAGCPSSTATLKMGIETASGR